MIVRDGTHRFPNSECHGLDTDSQHGCTTLRSCAGYWVTRLDQSARISVLFAATLLVIVTPSTTFGNWFAPFRRRHVFTAALTSLNTISFAVFCDSGPLVRKVRPPPAPFHVIPRGWAGPQLIAMVAFQNHRNRQHASRRFRILALRRDRANVLRCLDFPCDRHRHPSPRRVVGSESSHRSHAKSHVSQRKRPLVLEVPYISSHQIETEVGRSRRASASEKRIVSTSGRFELGTNLP